MLRVRARVVRLGEQHRMHALYAREIFDRREPSLRKLLPRYIRRDNWRKRVQQLQHKSLLRPRRCDFKDNVPRVHRRSL